MMRKKCITGLLLVFSLAAAGCGEISSEDTQDSYSIGVVLKSIDSPYWTELQTGMEQAALDYDISLNLLYPTGSEEASEQVAMANDLLNSDIDALIYAPVDCYDTKEIKRKADDEGICMLTVDDRAMDWLIPYVGSDHRLIGRMAAGFISRQLPDGGDVLVLLGTFTQQSCKERYRGIEEQLGVTSLPYDIRTVECAELTDEAGYQAVMDQEEPFDAVFCQNIALAQGVIAAMEERGWDATIVTVDTEEDGHQTLKRGKVDAILEQDGYEIGYQAVTSAVEALNKNEQARDVYFSSRFVE